MAAKGTQATLKNVLPEHIEDLERQGEKVLLAKTKVAEMKDDKDQEIEVLLKLMVKHNIGAFNVGARRFELSQGEVTVRETKARQEA